MLDKMKQLYQLQKQAREMQKELKETEIEAQGMNGAITVVINGELRIQTITIDERVIEPTKKRELERGLEDTLREALSKAQAIAAERSRAMMKSMNIDLPGL